MTDLTPEERKRIYEEEKARLEAEQSAPHQHDESTPGQDGQVRPSFFMRPLGGILLACGLTFGLIMIGTIHLPEQDSSSPSSEQRQAPHSEAPAEPPTFSPPPAVQAEPPPPDAKWRVVKTFSGSSIKNTEPFTIRGSQWRIQWAARPGQYGDGVFSITVKRPSDDPMQGYQGVAANIQGKGSDVCYEEGTGEFFLEINTTEPYGIVVEELR